MGSSGEQSPESPAPPQPGGDSVRLQAHASGDARINQAGRNQHFYGSLALHVGGGGVVWELEVDWPAGEHDGGKCGFGAVEAVGAADDQPYLVVQSFLATV